MEVEVVDPTMEGMGIWDTGIRTGLPAMQELRIGGTKERQAATLKLLVFFIWLLLQELTHFFLSLMKHV